MMVDEGDDDGGDDDNDEAIINAFAECSTREPLGSLLEAVRNRLAQGTTC